MEYLNTASSSELQQVPGMGPATADKILKARKSYGSFESVDDLLAIRGIGPKRLDKMRKSSTQAATTQSKSPPTKSSPVKPSAKAKAPSKPSADDEEER